MHCSEADCGYSKQTHTTTRFGKQFLSRASNVYASPKSFRNINKDLGNGNANARGRSGRVNSAPSNRTAERV